MTTKQSSLKIDERTLFHRGRPTGDTVMNGNQILNMIMRQIMRKGINSGIRRGMSMFKGKGRRADSPSTDDQDQLPPVQDDNRNT